MGRPTEEHFEINGLFTRRLRNAQLDDGRVPLLVIHGTMDRSAGFRRAIRRLEHPDIISFDRRGYAESRRSGLANTFEEQVDDIWSVINYFELPEVSVFGHSLGGLLALHAAQRHPERIRSLGAWELPSPWLEQYRQQAADARKRVFEESEPDRAVERFLRAMVGDHIWERLPATMRSEREEEGPALLADIAMVQRDEAYVDATAITIPTLLGVGGDSPARFHTSVQYFAQRLPHVSVREVPGAQHGIHLSHPDQMAEFLNSV